MLSLLFLLRLNSLGFIPPGSIRKSFIPPGLFIRALLIDALLLGASPSRFALEACPGLALQFGWSCPSLGAAGGWRCNLVWSCPWLGAAGGLRCYCLGLVASAAAGLIPSSHPFVSSSSFYHLCFISLFLSSRLPVPAALDLCRFRRPPMPYVLLMFPWCLSISCG